MSVWPDGLRVLHLQCRSGTRSLELARDGATVIGMDVAGVSVRQARARAAELGLVARFIEADLYDARHTLPEPEAFDVVYTDLADVERLPDMGEWARIVAWFLRSGGALFCEDPRRSSCITDALVAAGLSVVPAVDTALGPVAVAFAP